MNIDNRQQLTHKMLIRQQGLSLVELLVAMGLGIFLTWGATQAFLTGKQTYSTQQALSRIQENGRMAHEFFSYDIRNAGSYGCASGQFVAPDTTINLLANKSNDEFNFEYSVYGSNNVTATAAAGLNLATGLNPVPLPNTDVLIVHTATNLGLEVLGSPAPTATAISVNNLGLVTGNILSFSNCTSARIFQPTTIAAGIISYAFTSPSFPSPLSVMVGGSILKMETSIYYVANNASVPPQPALYRRTLADGGVSQELLTGVEDMQLEFGIDTNNDSQTDQFVTANAVTAPQWSAWDDITAISPARVNKGLFDPAQENVSAVRYSLLMRSDEQILNTPQTYTFNNVVVTATDKRLRQVFTGTVGIRGQIK